MHAHLKITPFKYLLTGSFDWHSALHLQKSLYTGLRYIKERDSAFSVKCCVHTHCSSTVLCKLISCRKVANEREYLFKWLLALKKPDAETHVLFALTFLFISDYFPGEQTGEIPTAGKHDLSLVCLMKRINEHLFFDC